MSARVTEASAAGGPVPVSVSVSVSVSLGARGVQVPDDEQGAAGRDPSGDAVVERQLRHRRVGVVGGDQVELSSRLPGREVGLDPVDPIGNLAPRRASGRAVERLPGDVGRGDPPAVRREPDRFATLAAPGIQRRTRHQSCGLAGEVRVDSLASSVAPATTCACSQCSSQYCWSKACATSVARLLRVLGHLRSSSLPRSGDPAPGPGRCASRCCHMANPRHADRAGPDAHRSGSEAQGPAGPPRHHAWPTCRRRPASPRARCPGSESGLRRPTLEQLLPLARAYGVTLDELVDAPATGQPPHQPAPDPLQRRLGHLAR